MTIERFQSTVLRVGNQLFTRHFLWLNYPHDPQLMGLAYKSEVDERRLDAELVALGFHWHAGFQAWVIERTA